MSALHTLAQIAMGAAVFGVNSVWGFQAAVLTALVFVLFVITDIYDSLEDGE